MGVYGILAVVVDEGDRQYEVAQRLWYLGIASKGLRVKALQRSEHRALFEKPRHVRRFGYARSPGPLLHDSSSSCPRSQGTFLA